MTDPYATGRRVLEALAEGRRIAIQQRKAQAADNERLVRLELDRDILAGHPERGRPGRISRRLRGRIGERGVRKILERLSSGSDCLRQTAAKCTAEVIE